MRSAQRWPGAGLRVPDALQPRWGSCLSFKAGALLFCRKLGRLGALLAALEAGPLQPAGDSDDGPPRSAAVPCLAKAAIEALTGGLSLLPAVQGSFTAEDAQLLASASSLLLGSGRRLLACEGWRRLLGRQRAASAPAAAAGTEQEELLRFAVSQVQCAEALLGLTPRMGSDEEPNQKSTFPPAATAAWLEAVVEVPLCNLPPPAARAAAEQGAGCGWTGHREGGSAARCVATALGQCLFISPPRRPCHPMSATPLQGP